MTTSEQQNPLWGDQPAWPKTPPAKSLTELKLEARDTPRGREYELRLFHADLLVLFIAAVTLVFDSLAGLAVAGALLVIVGAMTAVGRISWARTEAIAVVIVSVLLIGSSYAAREWGLANAQSLAFLDLTQAGLVKTGLTALFLWRLFLAFSASAGIAASLTDLRK